MYCKVYKGRVMSSEKRNYSRRRDPGLRRRRRQRELRRKLTLTGLGFFVIIAILIVAVEIQKGKDTEAANGLSGKLTGKNGNGEYITYIGVEDAPDIDEQFLTINEYSRPGTELEEVNGIVIHYVGNPGTTAQNNRNYFEGIATTHEASASSHFIVGLEGEIIQCVPLDEIAYASNQRNADTISIETCYTDESGRFNDITYDSLVHLTAWLMGEFHLEIDQVIRHYDVTGKECPKYYVKNEWAWDNFKEDVVAYIEKKGVEMKWQVEQ